MGLFVTKSASSLDHSEMSLIQSSPVVLDMLQIGQEVINAGTMEPVQLFCCCDATAVGFLDIGASSHGSVGFLGVSCNVRGGRGSRVVR